MSEKRGNTGKLNYTGFETHHVLEIQLANRGWYRVTEKDFRSFNGPRRTSKPAKTEHRKVTQELITEVYNGPHYYYGLNKTYNAEDYEKYQIIYSPLNPKKETKRTSVASI